MKMRVVTAVLMFVVALNPGPRGAWASQWEDTWNRSDVDIEGVCQPVLECAPYTPLTCDALPNRYRTFPSTTVAPADCDANPSSCTATDPANQLLYFHGQDVWNNQSTGGEGFPMISATTFSKDSYLSAEVEARAYCGPAQSSGCFLGLTLYNGESNYREIAYQAAPGSSAMSVWRYAGGVCNPEDLLVPVQQGTYHKLRLDYYGHEGGKWVYFVDDIVRRIEDAGSANLGSVLQADPRVGLFFVGFRDGSYVEGSLKPLRVWSGSYPDAQQTARADGYGATGTTWFAQQVFMGAGAANLTRVNLFLVTGQKYRIAAYTDNAGVPGTLINETLYTANRYGLQDVPLWVPARYERVWIRIASQTAAMAEFGTSAEGTNPYPGPLLYSTNAGATWAPVPRDMTFVTYQRK